jgi:Protein kinase domain
VSEALTVQLSRVGVAGVGGDGPVSVDVPKNIGPVRLIRQIGAGAMGVVWLGRHEVLARDVAVKFLLSPGATPGQGPEFEAFIQGARAAAAVRHPALTAVHDAGSASGVAYIVMEYVDGPTLHDLLRRGPLPHGAVRAVLADLCAGVAELHEQGLVHRDIKPSNIMIGADGTVVLTDFGLACPGRGPSPNTPVAGTPAYMAWEMFEGEVSAKTDIYAIGVTAFELLVGEPAVSGGLPMVRAAAKAGLDVRARLILAHVPQGVAETVERALNKDAMFRPKTARRLGEMFDQAFQAAGARSASREDLQQTAFAQERPREAAPGTTRPASKAATMFDLVAERAEQKRRSAPAQPIEEPAPVAPAPDPPAARMTVGALGPAPASRSPAMPVPQALPPEPSPAARAAPGPVSSRRAPVPWSRLLGCASAGAWVMVLTLLFMDRLIPGPGVIAARLAALWGLIEHVERSSAKYTIAGVSYSAPPPLWLLGLMRFGVGMLPFLLEGMVMFAVFHRVALKGRARPEGRREGVLCGWCGYNIAGVGPRCPECGRTPGDRGSKSDLPPAGRWRPRLRSVALAALALAVSLGITATAARLWIFDNPQAKFGAILGTVMLWMLIGFPTCLIGLQVYYLSARGFAGLDGVPRCGRCGREADPVQGCAACTPA